MPTVALLSTLTPAIPPTREPDNELLPILEELMETEICTLPCLWGLQPAVTTVDELHEFTSHYFDMELHELDGSRVGLDGMVLYSFFLLFQSRGSIRINYRTQDELLIQTNIHVVGAENWFDQNPFELSTLVQTLGTPTDVYIAINPTNPLTYSLALVYNHDGVMVEYVILPDDYEADKPLRVCSQTDETTLVIEIWLQAVDSDTLVVDNLVPSPYNTPRYGAFWTVEQMTGIDVESFTQHFLTSSDECIETYSFNELRELGYR
jgi:hypothetical protein